MFLFLCRYFDTDKKMDIILSKLVAFLFKGCWEPTKVESDRVEADLKENMIEATINDALVKQPAVVKYTENNQNGSSTITLVERQYRRTVVPQFEIEGSKHLPATVKNVDVLSSNIVLGDCHFLTSKYFNNIEDPALEVLTKEHSATQKEKDEEGHETARFQSRDSSSFLRMEHLKQRKEAQLPRKKDPPPGFYRMRERKRQKELAIQQQHQQQQQNSSVQSTSNRRLKPNRKRRSKSRSKRPQPFEEIINGEITDVVPEDFSVCLGSPSHNERIQKFREMFHKERISTTVRKFLF